MCIGWFMICLGPIIAGGLITPVLPDPWCHPSPDDTGWQLDMITNNLPEQSGPSPRASHEISENQFLICCLLGSDKTVISENKSLMRLRLLSSSRKLSDSRLWKSLIELILVWVFIASPASDAHFIPWHDHDCGDMTSESWWSATVMAG